MVCPRAEVHVAVVFPGTAMHGDVRCPRTNSAGLWGAQDRGVWGNHLPRTDVQRGTVLLRTGHGRLRTEVHRITVTWAFCAQDRCDLRHNLAQDTVHRSMICTWTGVPYRVSCGVPAAPSGDAMWGQPASQGGCVGGCGAGRRAWALHFGPPGGWGALGTAIWGQPWGRQCVSLCPKAAFRVEPVALGGNTELGDLPWGSAPGDPCVTLPGGWGQEVTLLACHCQCPQLMGSTGARLSSPHGDPHFPEPRTHKISPPLSLGGGRVPKHIARGSAPPNPRPPCGTPVPPSCSHR